MRCEWEDIHFRHLLSVLFPLCIFSLIFDFAKVVSKQLALLDSAMDYIGLCKLVPTFNSGLGTSPVSVPRKALIPARQP